MTITTDIRIDILNFFDQSVHFPAGKCRTFAKYGVVAKLFSLSFAQLSRNLYCREVLVFLVRLFGLRPNFPTRCSLPHHARVIQVRRLTLALVWPCANAPIRSQPPTLLKYYALTRIFLYTIYPQSFRSFSEPSTRAKGKFLELTSKYMQTEKRKKQVFPN